MNKLLIIVISALFFTSCGIKDNPEYKTYENSNKTINLV
jgi:hypothetical protein